MKKKDNIAIHIANRSDVSTAYITYIYVVYVLNVPNI